VYNSFYDKLVNVSFYAWAMKSFQALPVTLVLFLAIGTGNWTACYVRLYTVIFSFLRDQEIFLRSLEYQLSFAASDVPMCDIVTLSAYV